MSTLTIHVMECYIYDYIVHNPAVLQQINNLEFQQSSAIIREGQKMCLTILEMIPHLTDIADSIDATITLERAIIANQIITTIEDLSKSNYFPKLIGSGESLYKLITFAHKYYRTDNLRAMSTVNGLLNAIEKAFEIYSDWFHAPPKTSDDKRYHQQMVELMKLYHDVYWFESNCNFNEFIVETLCKKNKYFDSQFKMYNNTKVTRRKYEVINVDNLDKNLKFKYRLYHDIEKNDLLTYIMERKTFDVRDVYKLTREGSVIMSNKNYFIDEAYKHYCEILVKYIMKIPYMPEHLTLYAKCYNKLVMNQDHNYLVYDYMTQLRQRATPERDIWKYVYVASPPEFRDELMKHDDYGTYTIFHQHNRNAPVAFDLSVLPPC